MNKQTPKPAPSGEHSAPEPKATDLKVSDPKKVAAPKTAAPKSKGAGKTPPSSVGIETQSTSAVDDSTYLNRELSWLAFNERVLFEAQNESNPLLERLTYAAICGSNLDEFFMVRVAGVHRQIAANVTTKSLDGLLPKEVLNLVRSRTHVMLQGIEKVTRSIFKALQERGVEIGRVKDLGKRARATLREQYLSQIQPVLTPLIVDPSHPFPYISNLSLNLAVLIDAGAGEDPEFARVKVPVGVLPRIVKCGGQLLLLEDVIAEHLSELFRGRMVLRSHVFRVTRNTDYEFDEEEAEDLLATIEDGLRRRRFGSAVRLEVTRDMPAPMLEFLRSRLKLAHEDIFELQGPLGTANLMGLPVERPDLQFPTFSPRVPDLGGEDDEGIFHTLSGGDVLLHHPYDSFTNVLAFVQAAANDPDVLAIKQTLYRTGDDPRLIGALRTAAENGKQVVALIELKARFDEQRNISSARQLERVGAHVVYGVSGLKTHGKVTLVVRREGEKLKRYVHVGTGNYNPKTARLYTDLSLLSARDELGEDVAALFNHLTGYAEADYDYLLVAPDTARTGFLKLLEREAANVAAGKPGWARLKFNQLTDPQMIEALYKASQAGVKVQLMVRGVCCLRPGVAGFSENIEVRSLIGRFLEHARIYAFAGDASEHKPHTKASKDRAPDVYFGSADWMSRNLDRRVEVIAPLFDEKQKVKLLSLLDTEWADTRGAWVLAASGEYAKLSGDSSAQAAFMGAEELPTARTLG
ncbi:polyphosphate kinase 1 [Deinococcus detaillensis]|uniref:Polyphosphate kinase n=1 Tax=Deinococcus detaillensis TaxID=2592048 RepID=A0A553UQR8_9DEIO|nr:polyphosphate kinase 1 [Deinococcus detaillensis]TSA82532.1 polyphosphate kinase 1 [Deinococcus detaillensis]